MIDLEQLKQSISIVELAKLYGAEPKRESGNVIQCRYNPLREEKTSSLVLYPSTNTYNDFGGDGGSIIDFIMQADGVDVGSAIRKIKEMSGIEDMAPVRTVSNREPEYRMGPEAVEKVWAMQKHITFKTDEGRSELLAIAPEYVYKEADREDSEFFHDIVRLEKQTNVAFVLLKDENDIMRSARYRRYQHTDYETGDVDIRKWYALPGTKTSFPYMRIKNNDMIIIVEGTHDYLSCILAGYNVIALPSSGYKLDNNLIKDHVCLFMDDDDGKDFMRPLFDSADCSKIWFDHKAFKEKHEIDSAKDFSDYLEKFETLKEFRTAIDEYVASQDVADKSWKSLVSKIAKPISRKDLDDAANTSWMIDKVLIRNNITTLVGAPNVGKSALSFSMVDTLFSMDEIDMLLYFDADQPLGYVKTRIETLLDKHGEDRIHYYNGYNSNATEMVSAMDILANTRGGGDRVLIVIDSLKFYIKGSLNKDELVNPFYDMLKSIRDRFGATIVVLHHTRKSKDDDGGLIYTGSQSIEASTDNMIMLTRGEIFHKKSRSEMSGIRFGLDIDVEALTFSVLDQVEEDNGNDRSMDEDAEAILGYLVDHGPTNQTVIISDMAGTVSKARTKRILWDDKYKRKMWNVKKLTPKGYQFTAIETQPASSPEVYEYKMDGADLF